MCARAIFPSASAAAAARRAAFPSIAAATASAWYSRACVSTSTTRSSRASLTARAVSSFARRILASIPPAAAVEVVLVIPADVA